MKILFPSSPLNFKEVYPDFLEEFEAAKLVGFKCFLFDHDLLVDSGKLKTTLPSNEIKDVETIILRSWMLKENEYRILCDALFFKGYSLINTTEQYIQCHHLPNYYKFIKEYTAASSWATLEQLRTYGAEGTALGRKMLGEVDVLIKDYVKSAKGEEDIFILKKELNDEEFHARVEKFIEARGKLFDTGVVLRAFVDLKKYVGQTNEWRLFFLDGYLISKNFNSPQTLDVTEPADEVIKQFAPAFKQVNSKFFTVDLAEKADGSWMILEMGDGQVSGLATHEKPVKYYNNLLCILTGQEVDLNL
jgi:hypothetical protein